MDHQMMGLHVKILRALLMLSTAAALIMLLARITQTSTKEWADAKLAPVVAMSKGYDLYQDRDTGVMTGWLYGPIGAIILRPAALGKSPTTVRLIGNAITLICFLVPAAWLLAQALPAQRRSANGLYLAAFTFFTWLSVYAEDLGRCSTTACPDGPALGLAACACALIYRKRTLYRMALSALAAILCVWTKQTYLAFLPGLIAWILIADGRRSALIYLGMLAGIGAIVSAALLASFGASNMYFHMVTLPASHPLRDADAGIFSAWLGGCRDLLLTTSCSIGLLGIVILVSTLLQPTSSNIRSWVASRRWMMLMIVAISLIPASLSGYVKFGGFLNNLACTHYFLWLAGLAGVIEIFNDERISARLNDATLQTVFGTLTISGLMIGTNVVLAPLNGLSANAGTLLHPYSNNSESVFEYCRAHPQETYCPWDPLITLLADGKLYHFEWGLLDRDFAKLTPSDKQYGDYLPKFINKIVYTAPPQSIRTLQVLLQFQNQTQVNELPGCIVYTR